MNKQISIIVLFVMIVNVMDAAAIREKTEEGRIVVNIVSY